jgi:hypothetical protein
MVHALEEAWRVLEPGGLLLDLRPAMMHRRVAIIGGRGRITLGMMRERFDDDLVANQAVAAMLRQGLFRRTWRERVPCLRTMDTLEEFRAWFHRYVSLGKLPPHAWLDKKIQRALPDAGASARIVVSAPLELQVLEKRDNG